MDFQMTCSSCNHAFAAPEKYAGQKVKCPRCKSALQVPLARVTPREAVVFEPAVEQPESREPKPAAKRPSGGLIMAGLQLAFGLWWTICASLGLLYTYFDRFLGRHSYYYDESGPYIFSIGVGALILAFGLSNMIYYANFYASLDARDGR